MTQKEQVLDYIKKHGSISTIQAFHIGITRLSARIWDLKDEGVPIISKTIYYRADDGKRKRYDEYSLGGVNEE